MYSFKISDLFIFLSFALKRRNQKKEKQNQKERKYLGLI